MSENAKFLCFRLQYKGTNIITLRSNMADSIFSKIIKGEIPSQKIYEDENVLAFLDIHPLVPGHVLVVPKKEVDHFDDMDPQTYQAVFDVVQKVAKRIKEVMGAKRACVRIEGFDVPHAHIHVYGCDQAKDFYGDPERLHKEPDFGALAEVAKKLAF